MSGSQETLRRTVRRLAHCHGERDDKLLAVKQFLWRFYFPGALERILFGFIVQPTDAVLYIYPSSKLSVYEILYLKVVPVLQHSFKIHREDKTTFMEQLQIQ